MLILTATCWLISIVALFQIDTVVHQQLYEYGLQFSSNWAIPYWNALAIVFAAAWTTIVAAVGLQLYTMTRRTRKTASHESAAERTRSNIYRLSDGTTIKIKTELKGVKRLNRFTEDGKPVYSVNADNLVEIVEVPEQLMAPANQAA